MFQQHNYIRNSWELFKKDLEHFYKYFYLDIFCPHDISIYATKAW